MIFNYRLIYLCSIPCKMFERIIVKRSLEHSQKYGIIPDSQHGFLPKRSCTTQADSLFYEWAKILDQSTPPRIYAVFLDWVKAFHKVNHHLLLKKLHKYGVCGKVLLWIKSLLFNRKQSVLFEGARSDWVSVSSGVVQGSVIGPILFNLYVADLFVLLFASMLTIPYCIAQSTVYMMLMFCKQILIILLCGVKITLCLLIFLNVNLCR